MAYLYGENGNKIVKELQTEVDFGKTELLKLAVFLKNQKDEKLIWDCNIKKINYEIEIEKGQLEEFQANATLYDAMINRMKMMSMQTM